jgi:hypothetical protein
MIVDEKPSALHLAGYAKYLSSRFGLEVERPVPYRWVWSAPEGKVLKWNVEKPAETNKSD